MGLGIGVNTSIFSIVRAVLQPSLPMVRPHEVVDVYTAALLTATRVEPTRALRYE